MLELLALLLCGGKLVNWSFGGGVSKGVKKILQAEQDMKDGKITWAEYCDIKWNTKV